jgi:hypothetical protein
MTVRQTDDLNDPDYVWTVFKRKDTGEILGPVISMEGPWFPHSVTHAKLLDNGQWVEQPPHRT